MEQPITNHDIWAAIRGLQLYGKTDEELAEIIEVHGKIRRLFASRVIAEAARQVLATRRSD